MPIGWTRTRMAPAHARFVDELHFWVRHESACYVHAAPSRAEEWEYADSARAAARSALAAERPVTFSGHVHEQRLYVSDVHARMAPLAPAWDVEIALPAERR